MTWPSADTLIQRITDMNEQMKNAWLEISQMLGEPTREELDVFLRTWQRAMQAEREECARVCDAFQARDVGMQPAECAGAIRARSNP
jgi:hypothetical protein